MSRKPAAVAYPRSVAGPITAPVAAVSGSPIAPGAGASAHQPPGSLYPAEPLPGSVFLGYDARRRSRSRPTEDGSNDASG
jgi:hypothetical protein